MNATPGRRGSRATHFLLWTVLVLILVGAGAVLYVNWQGERRLASERRVADERAERLLAARAGALAQAIAVMGRDALAGGRTESLQESVDELIRQPGIVSISILDREGRVVVATDRRALGRALEAESAGEAMGTQEPLSGEGFVYVPVMGYTRRLGTVHLEYDPREAGPASRGEAGGDASE